MRSVTKHRVDADSDHISFGFFGDFLRHFFKSSLMLLNVAPMLLFYIWLSTGTPRLTSLYLVRFSRGSLLYCHYHSSSLWGPQRWRKQPFVLTTCLSSFHHIFHYGTNFVWNLTPGPTLFRSGLRPLTSHNTKPLKTVFSENCVNSDSTYKNIFYHGIIY